MYDTGHSVPKTILKVFTIYGHSSNLGHMTLTVSINFGPFVS